MTISELSLDDLGRRVGLAKFDVLRYFESREAILLELFGRELQDWLVSLTDSTSQAGNIRERGL